MRYLAGDLESLSTSTVDGVWLCQRASRLRCSPWLDLAHPAMHKYGIHPVQLLIMKVVAVVVHDCRRMIIQAGYMD